MVSNAEIGRYLASVRERAGLKQNELAKRVTWSAAVLSRVEAGERPLSVDELDDLLTAIGTDEALHLQKVMGRTWQVLARPPVGHQDNDLLWEAEVAAQQLRDLRERDDVKHAFERRLSEYLDELSRTANMLLTTEHQVAFIGSIGVGKSTAICRMTELEVPGANVSSPSPVLEVGGGGVTICEVHLRQGPGYGLIVEPRSDEEIRQDVTDFADFFLKSKDAAPDEQDSSDGDLLGISKEIARAIRNMAGLRIRRDKGADGKQTRKDEAKELAATFGDSKALTVEILARMELHRRDRRDIWYSASTGKEPLPWLKESFELMNNGRHPEFSLPRRIEVVVPQPILGTESLSIRLIDTKGIDQTAERADLEHHFDDAHTVSILCSSFNDAPAAATQQLLKRAIEGGVRTLAIKAAVLALPRPGEALAVKDDEGYVAESAQEGYELKGEQVAMQLQHLGLRGMPVAFFNARDDDPKIMRDFILGRIDSLRNSYRSHLKEVISGTHTLLANYEKEQVQEVLREAARRLGTWLKNNREVASVSWKVSDSLLAALSKAHPSTIRATVRREGEWPNLEYSHHLGYGARRIAAASVEPRLGQFKAIAENLLQDPELTDAHDLVQQALRLIESAIDGLLRKVQLLGQATYTDELKEDQTFWQGCEYEWGQGAGYRDRITYRNTSWFNEATRAQQQEYVRALILKEWGQVLDRLAALLAIEA